MNSILITGSKGFVGENLCKYFSEIYNVKRLSIRYKKDQKIIINENLVIHAAGKAHDLKKATNPVDCYESNFELTKQIFDAFLKSDAKKFIFISSVKAVADSLDGILLEDDLPNPKTDYGISKLRAEQYIQSQKLPPDKSYYILRPCMIHGPGNKGNLNLLYKFVEKSIPYPLAAFENKRSFLSIHNLCFVINELLMQNCEAGVYNVSDDQVISTNKVVSILSISLGKRPKLYKVSVKLIKLFAKIGDYLKLPLNSERLQKLTESYIVSNQKIKKAIGKNLPLNTKEGLMITANSFKN